jgi:hypothetical protein
MRHPVAWARWWGVVARLASAGALVGGCATQGADDAASFVAVVPAASAPPVTVNETYVTQVHMDPGCVPEDIACLEAACARGSGHGCEARGDLYQERDDLQALTFYGRALQAYRAACDRGDDDACAEHTRLSAPGYGAHLYIAEPAFSPPPLPPAPVGTTVVINGNHNVVQVFGSAAKVVGTSTGKTKSARPAPP